MEKRVLFKSRWLPWVLIAPQVVVITVFFFWPAGQALLQSFQLQDAFGMSTEWVGLDNFRALFADPSYLESFKITAWFSLLVAGLGIAISLVLAVFADRIVRAALLYKTFMIVPYAVAPAVAGVLWLFMFSPTLGVVAYALAGIGIDWNYLLNSDHAIALIVFAAVWKQISYNFLFFLAGLQSIPKSLIEAAAIDGAGPWRRFWTHPVPAAVADCLLPAGDQHRLCVLRHLLDRRRDDPGWSRPGHDDPGLQGLQRRLQERRSRRLGGAVGGPDGDRHCADRDPVPLRRKEGELLIAAPSDARTACPAEADHG